MTVYILFCLYDDGGYTLIGLYKDRTLAERRKAAIEGSFTNERWERKCQYIIKESQVNEKES